MQHDPFNLSQRDEHERARRERTALLALQEVEDLRWLMSDPAGRRLMWGLLDRAGLYRISYRGDAGTEFREGGRNLGLVYWSLIQTHCVEQCGLMLEENNNDRTSS